MEIKENILKRLLGDKRIVGLKPRCYGKRGEFIEWEAMIKNPKQWFDYVNKKSLIEGVLYPYMKFALSRKNLTQTK